LRKTISSEVHGIIKGKINIVLCSDLLERQSNDVVKNALSDVREHLFVVKFIL
jgi:hypothetical protein